MGSHMHSRCGDPTPDPSLQGGVGGREERVCVAQNGGH
jgi:hypothetical protein